MKKRHMREYIDELEDENEILATSLALMEIALQKYKSRCQKLEDFMAEKGIHIIWSEEVD